MTRRRNGKTDAPGLDPDILEELFPGSDNGPRVDFDKLECATIGRLITAVAGLGGMVTFYRSSADNTLCISVRIGERKRSYSFDGGENDDIVLDQLTNTYYAAWGRYLMRQRDATTS